MVRRVFALLLLAISTLLLLAVACDWVYSFKSSETLLLVRKPRVYAIDSFHGQASLWTGDLMSSSPTYENGLRHRRVDDPGARPAQEFSVVDRDGRDFWFAQFGLTTQRRFPTTAPSAPLNDVIGQIGIAVPLWFLTVVFGVMPVVTLVRSIRRARRYAEGCCPACGYDLRASVDRCPECGRAFSSATVASPVGQTETAPSGAAE
jgi:hypothetical protein